MGKVRRFCAEAGALGVGSVIFACVLWIVAAVEHERGENIPATWFLFGGCAAFCFGAFMAWSKADDRANERKPKLGLWADRQSLYLTHLQGDPARFIKIDPILKRPDSPHSTKLHFDPIDFLSSAMTSCQRALSFRLEILPGDKLETDVGKVIGVMFSDHSQPSASFPVTIRFLWNHEEVKEKIILTWIHEEKRFETRPQQ
jgi:hypothetical protein